MIVNKDLEYLHTNCFYRQYKNGTGVLYPAAVRKKRNPEFNITRVPKKKIREFRIDRKKVQSASIDLFTKKRGKCILFITFTFPGKPTEKQTGQAWGQMLHSLRETYGVVNYVWVKEYQKRGVIHYHILIDKTFIAIGKLQQTFNRICNHLKLPVSNGSVSLGERPRVFDIRRVKYYLSKYIAKGKEDADRIFIFNGRCYGFSALLELFKKWYYSDLDNILKNNKPFKIIHDSFFSVFYFDLIFT